MIAFFDVAAACLLANLVSYFIHYLVTAYSRDDARKAVAKEFVNDPERRVWFRHD